MVMTVIEGFGKTPGGLLKERLMSMQAGQAVRVQGGGLGAMEGVPDLRILPVAGVVQEVAQSTDSLFPRRLSPLPL